MALKAHAAQTKRFRDDPNLVGTSARAAARNAFLDALTNPGRHVVEAGQPSVGKTPKSRRNNQPIPGGSTGPPPLLVKTGGGPL